MDIEKETLIYTVIAGIQAGKVASYGQVATLAGFPQNSRLVGRLLKIMPSDSVIPWHRVVNSQGKIAFPVGSNKYQELCSYRNQWSCQYSLPSQSGPLNYHSS